MNKLQAGLFVAAWLLFWVNWLGLILMLLIEKDKKERLEK